MLYDCKCPDCKKIFRTDNPEQRICSTCLKLRKPRGRKRKNKSTKKPLTFAEILHIAEVYRKIHHKYLSYGDVVNRIASNADHCVCCGEFVPEGRQICPQCENKVK